MLRLNILTWNPLEKECKDLEKMEWYETAMKYGFKPNEIETQLLDDPDIRLVPSLMEKIVLPKITGIKLINPFRKKSVDLISILIYF